MLTPEEWFESRAKAYERFLDRAASTDGVERAEGKREYGETRELLNLYTLDQPDEWLARCRELKEASIVRGWDLIQDTDS